MCGLADSPEQYPACQPPVSRACSRFSASERANRLSACGRALRRWSVGGRGRQGNEQDQGTAAERRRGAVKMSDKPLVREREPIERVRARLEALVRANAAPRCGARSKRTGKPCRGAAMLN